MTGLTGAKFACGSLETLMTLLSFQEAIYSVQIIQELNFIYEPWLNSAVGIHIKIATLSKTNNLGKNESSKLNQGLVMMKGDTSRTPLIRKPEASYRYSHPVDMPQGASDAPVSSATSAIEMRRRELLLSRILYPFKVCYFVVKQTVAVCLVVISPIALFILLAATSSILRLVQFFMYGEAYDQIAQLRLLVNFWILISNLLLTLELGVVYLLAPYVIGLPHDQIMIKGIPISSWAHIWFAIVLFCVNYLGYVTCHLLVPSFSEHNVGSRLNVQEAFSEIMSCFFMYVAYYMVEPVFYSLDPVPLLWEEISPWIQISYTFLFGYNLITLAKCMVVSSMQRFYRDTDSTANKISLHYLLGHVFLHSKYLMYFTNGLKESAQFILSSLWFFFSLYLFFWPTPTYTPPIPQEAAFLDFQFRTCLSIVLCSFFWPIKTCLLLAWEAQSVYGKLGPQIVKTGKRLYFLGVLGRHKVDIFSLRYEGQVSRTGLIKSLLVPSTSRLGDHVICPDVYHIWNQWDDEADELEERIRTEDENTVMKMSKKRRNRIKGDLLMLKDYESSTMYDIQQAAEYFLTTKIALLKEKNISDILNHLKSVGNSRGLNMSDMFKQLLNCNGVSEESMGNDEWDLFLEPLKLESPEDISDEELQRWMERAHNSCVLLATALSSAKEVGEYLNRIMTALLITASFICWLLLTGLANSSALVLVASPLLAVTFIFGETCKTMFQGIIFVYVVHPFDVGDVCVIEGKRMVVKAIDIWKTAFLELNEFGSEGNRVIIPNSQLSNQKITYPNTEFEWDDEVLFDVVASLHKPKMKELIDAIEQHLIEKEEEYRLHSHEVVRSLGDRTKIHVRVKYKISKIQDGTYFDYRQLKEKLRDAFVPRLQKYINEFGNQVESEASGACGTELSLKVGVPEVRQMKKKQIRDVCFTDIL